jgi:hypothetical protein
MLVCFAISKKRVNSGLTSASDEQNVHEAAGHAPGKRNLELQSGQPIYLSAGRQWICHHGPPVYILFFFFFRSKNLCFCLSRSGSVDGFKNTISTRQASVHDEHDGTFY